jgi:hypothetical protein
MRKLTLDVLAFVVLTAAVLAAIEHNYALSAALFVVAVGLAIVW